MLRIPNILTVGVVVASVIGCGDPPLSVVGDESESGDASESGGEPQSNESETGGSDTEQPCAGFCQVQEDCDADPYFSYEDCLAVCAKEQQAADAAEGCPAALTGFYGCVGELSCGEFDALYDDEDGPCYDEVVLFEELCEQAISCELIGGADEQGSFCTYQFDCYGSGEHRVECTAEDGCICLLDGDEVGSCDSLYPALCEPLDPVDPNRANATIVERLNDCCGWALEL